MGSVEDKIREIILRWFIQMSHYASAKNDLIQVGGVTSTEERLKSCVSIKDRNDGL